MTAISLAFLRLVAACRPEFVFGEQVASAAVLGPVGGAARAPAEDPAGWAWFDALATDLEAASYAVAAADLPAAGIGAPHIRQRLFFGAVMLGLGATGSPRARRCGAGSICCPACCTAGSAAAG